MVTVGGFAAPTTRERKHAVVFCGSAEKSSIRSTCSIILILSGVVLIPWT